MEHYTNKLFLFESLNLKISKIYACNMIIIYAFGNPSFNIWYRLIFHFIKFFFLESWKKMHLKIKNWKKMGQIRGESIGGGEGEIIFLKPCPHSRKTWNGVPGRLSRTELGRGSGLPYYNFCIINISYKVTVLMQILIY